MNLSNSIHQSNDNVYVPSFDVSSSKWLTKNEEIYFNLKSGRIHVGNVDLKGTPHL